MRNAFRYGWCLALGALPGLIDGHSLAKIMFMSGAIAVGIALQSKLWPDEAVAGNARQLGGEKA